MTLHFVSGCHEFFLPTEKAFRSPPPSLSPIKICVTVSTIGMTAALKQMKMYELNMQMQPDSL